MFNHFNKSRIHDNHDRVSVGNIKSTKSCLHILSEKGKFELTMDLLNMIKNSTRRSEFLKATVLTDLDGRRPRYLASIHLAAFHGHKKLVELFLENGIDVDTCTNKKDTPLMWAVCGNHVETVRLLIKHKANLKLQNDKDATPLMLAIRYGFTELVGVLLNGEQAEVGHDDNDDDDCKMGSENKVHANVGYDCKMGLEKPILLVLLNGEQTEVGHDDNDDDDDDCKMGSENKVHANVGYDCKVGLEKPIVLAAALGHKKIVSKLLDCRFASNAKISHGMTALMVAASEGHDDVVKLLVHRGRKDELEVVDKIGNTALLHASRAGNLSTMGMLVHHGASIDARNRLGETVWHHAIWRDDCDDGDDFLRAVAVLYRRAKRIDGRDMKFAKGCSPLQVYHIFYYPHLL